MHFRLVLLLWLMNYASAQDANCDFYQILAVGDVRYINSPNYSNNYRPGVQCRWIVDSPVGYNVRMDCSDIRIPQTPSCTADRLMVSTSGDPQLNGAQNYCGTGTLSGILSVNRRLTIGLIAAANSEGGRFACTVRTQAVTPTPTKCRCGERRQNRIVGGQEAGVNEFTMMAGIANRIPQIICGGVIISAKHVMTAGHCVYNESPSNYAVIVGEHDVTTGVDTSAAKGYRILKFTVHPSYNQANYDNDIAIVFIDGVIEFSDLILPVCLPFNYVNRDFAGNKVTLAGWGTTEIGKPTSNVLLKVDVDVLQQSTCRTRGAPVTDRQMCTWTSGKDSCQYDSGGPVLWTDPTTGAVHGVGIISFGKSCASGTPSTNTRVTSYLPWIMSVTSTNQGNYCIK